MARSQSDNTTHLFVWYTYQYSNWQWQVLDYSYKKIIQSESELHPVLFSEAPWNKKDRREQVRNILGGLIIMIIEHDMTRVH